MKNNIGRPFLLLLLTVGILLTLKDVELPRRGNFELKPIHLLSDITQRDTVDHVAKALAHLPKVKPIKKDTVPPGVTGIEDYADSTGHGMRHFYEALRRVDSLDRPVRIAYFGDSFIEGDILTADLRELLQNKFGGMGAGFTDVAPPFAGFRNTIYQVYKGWDVRNVLQRDSCERGRLSLTQRYAMPLDSAYTDLRGTRQYAHLDSFEVATLYISSPYPVSVKVRSNYGAGEHLSTEGTGRIETLRTRGNLRRVRYYLQPDSLTTCYGVALEGRKGIVLDNFSLRGSGGGTLGSLPRRLWKDFGRVRPYDLIVLHFGLNVASKEVLDYAFYVRSLSLVLDRMKEAYPETSFLIVGVSDREDKIDGELRTMPGVKALMKYQQQAAAQNHIAFWNLYEAMGGEGSIVKMADAEPRGARKDYTHITRHGGKVIAEKFYKSLIYDYDKFIKKDKHATK